jgi:hypothetical protein
MSRRATMTAALAVALAMMLGGLALLLVLNARGDLGRKVDKQARAQTRQNATTICALGRWALADDDPSPVQLKRRPAIRALLRNIDCRAVFAQQREGVDVSGGGSSSSGLAAPSEAHPGRSNPRGKARGHRR